jgi:hypothetical protein
VRYFSSLFAEQEEVCVVVEAKKTRSNENVKKRRKKVLPQNPIVWPTISVSFAFAQHFCLSLAHIKA